MSCEAPALRLRNLSYEVACRVDGGVNFCSKLPRKSRSRPLFIISAITKCLTVSYVMSFGVNKTNWVKI